MNLFATFLFDSGEEEEGEGDDDEMEDKTDEKGDCDKV